MFKRGDYVRVKPGTKLDNGEVAEDWAGEVVRSYKEEKSCAIALDAPTLDSLSDEYILSVVEEGAEITEYIFAYNELEPAKRRDTDEAVMAAIDRLVDREIALSGEEETRFWDRVDKWSAAFAESRFSEALSALEQENAQFVASIFMEFMYRYEGVRPDRWKPRNVEAVCLEFLPGKLFADKETFEMFGKVLMAFLNYLGEEGHINNADELVKTVDRIKDQIPVHANDSSRWGMTKGLMMGGKAEGLDLSSEEQIEAFLRMQQAQAVKSEPDYKQGRPVQEDPFNGIGRNQKITVRYKDGSIKSDIKFKKVEKDLRAGRCEMVKG